MRIPVVEYNFLENCYMSSSAVYEEILCECINTSNHMKQLCGGAFQSVEMQTKGEPDVCVEETGYELDFKLMISETLKEFQSLSLPSATERALGVKVIGGGRLYIN